LGRYLVSEQLEPEQVTLNGKTYLLDLRPKRIYKPYSITLLHFSHDRYLGTDEAKNFASRIRLVDPTRNVDREVLIWMNHPLRYNGETFYQQRFMQQDKGTILQVTSNPGMLLPYIGLALGGLGLLIHFGIRLVNFLQWAFTSATAAPAPARGRATAEKGQVRRLPPTTVPLIARPAFWISALTVAVGGLFVLGMAVRPAMDQPAKDAFDFSAFGQLPVVSDGRVLPFDSLARNTLRILSGRETLKRDGKSIPAIQWLLDGFSGSEAFRTDKFIRIDHPEVLGALDLDPKQKYFSLADLESHIAELEKQSNMAIKMPADQRDSFQRKVIQLADSIMLLKKAVMSFRSGEMYVVPPSTVDQQWRTISDIVKDRQQAGSEVPQAAVLLVRCVDDYQHGQASSFNSDVVSYDKYLQENLPDAMQKVRFEAYFNQFEPFYLCVILYVAVLILGFMSWLGWRRPLGAAALSLLVLTLLVHTFGLAARIWIQGRPPVTNLYSASIFVGWGVTVLCVGLEICWRRGIGTVAAAIVGFVTLIIAHFLSTDAMLQPNGDTMAVLQAVLDTNLWLATHVVCITLGYSSTFLAALLGIIYLGLGLFTPSLDKDTRKSLGWMIYGIVCFAMFFSFVGTILGGIWADQSWGRFWGWDPKENGAILVVIFNALILHARWSGMVRERGMAVLAIFGNIVTSWSFMGTNMLGIGLHAYGFMDQAVPWLVGFWLFNLALIACGMIPLSHWRSYQVDTELAGAR
jgi:ABC-type transport system involved in cytochrome c biogenesis permease subunit